MHKNRPVPLIERGLGRAIDKHPVFEKQTPIHDVSTRPRVRRVRMAYASYTAKRFGSFETAFFFFLSTLRDTISHDEICPRVRIIYYST